MEDRTCAGCGNSKAWVVHKKREAYTGIVYEECNKCFNPSIPANPDVYFKEPYWDENLMDWDDPSCNNETGTWITSKAHKAYVMKKLGIREAGDRKHGYRNDEHWRYREKKGLDKKY